MKRFIAVLSLGALSGCSWLFHDHAEDYVLAKETPEIQVPTELKQKPFQQILVIPDVPVAANDAASSGKFVVPRPEPLDIQDDDEAGASLADLKDKSLSPQISKDGNGTPVLRLGADFPQAWAALGDALNKADIKVSDLNRSIGTYYIEYQAQSSNKEKGFWARLWGSEDASITDYELKVNRARSGVYIALHIDSDTLADENIAQSLLQTLANKLQ